LALVLIYLSVLLVGRAKATFPPPADTAPVAVEVAGVEPPPFVAVTVAESVCPTSPLTGV